MIGLRTLLSSDRPAPGEPMTAVSVTHARRVIMRCVTAETYYGRDLPPDGYRSRRGRAVRAAAEDGERIRFTSKTIAGLIGPTRL